eukprot:762538-Hanusia_phi.AAC.6
MARSKTPRVLALLPSTITFLPCGKVLGVDHAAESITCLFVSFCGSRALATPFLSNHQLPPSNMPENYDKMFRGTAKLKPRLTQRGHADDSRLRRAALKSEKIFGELKLLRVCAHAAYPAEPLVQLLLQLIDTNAVTLKPK